MMPTTIETIAKEFIQTKSLAPYNLRTDLEDLENSHDRELRYGQFLYAYYAQENAESLDFLTEESSSAEIIAHYYQQHIVEPEIQTNLKNILTQQSWHDIKIAWVNTHFLKPAIILNELESDVQPQQIDAYEYIATQFTQLVHHSRLQFLQEHVAWLTNPNMASVPVMFAKNYRDILESNYQHPAMYSFFYLVYHTLEPWDTTNRLIEWHADFTELEILAYCWKTFYEVQNDREVRMVLPAFKALSQQQWRAYALGLEVIYSLFNEGNDFAVENPNSYLGFTESLYKNLCQAKQYAARRVEKDNLEFLIKSLKGVSYFLRFSSTTQPLRDNLVTELSKLLDLADEQPFAFSKQLLPLVLRHYDVIFKENPSSRLLSSSNLLESYLDEVETIQGDKLRRMLDDINGSLIQMNQSSKNIDDIIQELIPAKAIYPVSAEAELYDAPQVVERFGVPGDDSSDFQFTPQRNTYAGNQQIMYSDSQRLFSSSTSSEDDDSITLKQLLTTEFSELPEDIQQQIAKEVSGTDTIDVISENWQQLNAIEKLKGLYKTTNLQLLSDKAYELYKYSDTFNGIDFKERWKSTAAEERYDLLVSYVENASWFLESPVYIH